MKTAAIIGALLLSSANAFAPAFTRHVAITSERSMFGGSGGAGPLDPEQRTLMEQSAAAMGMTVDEYALGMRARQKFEADIAALKVSGGSADVTVEADVNSPPQHLVVTISEAGKAKGADALSADLVAAFKEVNESSKKGRAKCQQDMMMFISENMKK
jgi:hypothetical protein